MDVSCSELSSPFLSPVHVKDPFELVTKLWMLSRKYTITTKTQKAAHTYKMLSDALDFHQGPPSALIGALCLFTLSDGNCRDVEHRAA